MRSFSLLLITIFNINTIFAQVSNKPFPNHTNYAGKHIKPNSYTQSELDSQTQLFYDKWKYEYLKNDCGNTDEYYVFSGGGSINVSEAQGYGMMITAYFAGYDANAQILFDGLYKFYKSHPSNINNSLMDWQQVTYSDLPSEDDNAASDGDIDIAFALLLAHVQWGSNGNINYLFKAQVIINAIMQDEINKNTWTVKLGDWCNESDANYFYGTRASDFITDHFKVFNCINNDWNNVVNTCYSLISNIQNNYSSITGLIPDFIINTNTNTSPAGAYYLEENTDGDYSYNACRIPWRLGTDYLINNDLRAKTALDNINAWLISSTNGNTDSISNGYSLNGIAQFNWNDATFIGPFTVSAMLDITHQIWLNNLYEELITNNYIDEGDYYSNTIKLLSLITISGNYWAPNCNNINISSLKGTKDNIWIYPNITKGIIYINFVNNNKNTTINIMNINGKLITSKLLEDKFNTIDITSYNNGIYFISIITNNKIITNKIIKY